jgi:alpha-tubulin suppressor-like RCC1 family protein
MEECVQTPQLIEGLKSDFIVEIACGETHSVALTREGKVFGWGMSMYGQLGLGFSADSFEPGVGLTKSKVPKPTEITEHLPPTAHITKIYCGAAFTLMQTKQGELYGCGINDLG